MTNNDRDLQQQLEGLKRDHQQLRDKKIAAEASLKQWSEELTSLQAEAEKLYGTSDPAKLQALLEEKRAENAKMVAEYRTHLQEVQESLELVKKETLHDES